MAVKKKTSKAVAKPKSLTKKAAAQRKTSRSAGRDNKWKYEAMINASINAFIITTPEGIIVEVNKAASAIFGYKAKELINLHRDIIIDPNDDRLPSVLKYRSKKGTARGELTGIRKNGESFPIEFSSASYLDEDGEIYFCTIITDISERKQQQREMELLVYNTRESYVLLDRSLKIVSFNNQFGALYQQYLGKVVKKGDSILNYAQPERRDTVRALYKSVMQGAAEQTELVIPTKEHGIKYIIVHYLPAKDETGNIIGVFVTATDVTEQREAEQREKKTALLLKETETISHVGSWELDLQTNEIYWSDEVYRICGYEPQEFKVDFAKGLEVIHPDDREAVVQQMRDTLEKGTEYRMEKRFVTRNNEVKQILSRASLIYDVNGKPVKLIGIFQDITEMKETQLKLLESERMYRTLFQENPVPVWIYDLETLQFLEVNEQAILKYGYSRNEFLNMTIRDIRPEEDVVKLKEIVRIKYGTSDIYHGTWRHVLKYGKIIQVEITSHLINYNGRKASLVLAIDVTEKNKAAEKLVQLNKDFELILQSTDEGIYGIDEMGLCTFINRAAARMFGYSPEECIGKNMHQLTHHTRRDGRPYPEKQCSIYRLRVNQGGQLLEDELFWRKDGTSFDVRVTCSPIIDEGKSKGAVIAFNDITAQKKLLAEITRLQSKQEAIINSTDDLIWSVDKNIQLVMANNAFVKVLSDMAGINIKPGSSLLLKDHFPAAFLEVWTELYRKALSGVSFTEDIFTPAGENYPETWAEVRFNPIIENGIVTGVACYSRDITGFKRYEKNILDINQKLVTAQKIGQLGYWELDMDQQTLYWSDEVYRIWGVNPDEFAVNFNNFYQTIHPDDRAKFDAAQEPAIKGQGVLEIEHRIILPDGSIKHVYEKGALVLDEKGIPVRFEGTVQDITARVKAAEVIQGSEEKRKLIMNAALDAIICIDLQGKVTFWNPAAAAIFGWTEKEIMGKLLSDYIIPKQHREGHERAMERYRANGSGQRLNKLLELTGVRKNGEEFPIELTVMPVQQGEEEFFCAFIRETTEQKKAIQRVKESEEKYRVLFNFSPLPKFIFDSETLTLLEVNETALLHYGYSREQFRKMALEDYFTEADALRFREIFEKEKQTDGKKSLGLFHQKTQKGKHIIVEMTVYETKFNERNCIIVVCNDVTQTIQKQELEKLEREVMEASMSGRIPVKQLFEKYLLGIESILPEVKTSILKIEESRVYTVSAPSLPASYTQAIEGSLIGPEAGSCGTAAYLKKRIASLDIEQDPLWATYKQYILPYGLNSCWSQPIFDSQGEVIATFAFYYGDSKDNFDRDQLLFEKSASLVSIILENYAAKEDLVKSNQRFEYVQQATFDAIWDWDLSSNILYWGNGFAQLFGYEIHQYNEVVGGAYEHIHPDDRDAVVESINAAIKNKEVQNWQKEYRYQRADGSYANVIDRGVIIRDKKGIAVRMIGAMSDISQLKLAEKKLAEERNLLRILVDSLPDYVYVKDKNTRHLLNNKKMLELLGADNEEETLNRSLVDFFGADGAEIYLSDDREVLASGEPLLDKLEPLYTETGELRWLSTTKIPIINQQEVQGLVGVSRDITESVIHQKEKEFLLTINKIFTDETEINNSYTQMLRASCEYFNRYAAELWVTNIDQKLIHLAAFYHSRQQGELPDEFCSLERGMGLPGICWERKETVTAADLEKDPSYLRKSFAKKYQLANATAIPILYKGVVNAVIMFYEKEGESPKQLLSINQSVLVQLAGDIQRKKTENELNRFFTYAPELLCIAGADGYFKKINPAFTRLLGYSEEEILSQPFTNLVHPDDLKNTINELKDATSGQVSYSFENRYRTKSGDWKWISWSSSEALDSTGLVFGYGKDVTAQKELEKSLDKIYRLARIGVWELNILKNSISWSPVTREIHEAPDDYLPSLEEGISFYKEGESRDNITRAVNNAIEKGEAFDLELQIVTCTGKDKWVRAQGEAEFRDGICSKLYGSFQDIDDRKRAELAFRNSLEERNVILESIGDAFFAMDRNYVVSYWNKEAEKLIGVKREQVLGKRLWEVFTDAAETASYRNYREAFETNTTVYFEDYYVGKWLEISAYPSENGLSVYFKDISDRKIAEQNLLQFKKVIENSKDGIGIISTEDKQIYMNSALIEMLGYDAAGLTALGGAVQVYEDTKQGEIMFSTIMSGQYWKGDVQLRNRWGKVLELHLSAGPVINDKGEVIAVYGIHTDISQRKQMERALLETNNRITTILESITDGFFSINPDWTVTYWNKEAAQLMGTRPQDIVGKNLWDVFRDMIPLKFYDEFHQALEKDQAVHFEEYFAPLNRWFEVSAYPSSAGLSVYFKDVTERKKAEEEIKLSNERYALSSQASNDSIWDWDLKKNTVQRPGRKLENIFGYPVINSEEVDAFWKEKVHPDDWQRITQLRTAILQNPHENFWNDEYRFLKPDGTYAYVSDKAYILRDKTGVAERMIGASRDITKEKEEFNEVARIRQNLDSLINNTSDMIWSVDKELRIIASNKTYADTIKSFTGVELKEGDSVIKEEFGEEMVARWKKLYQRGLSGESFNVNETLYHPSTGIYSHSMISFSPIKAPDGKIYGVACYAKDVTELRNTALQLETLNQQLQKQAHDLAASNKELEQFAYVASHDLQEPLRMVTNFLTQLEKKYGNVLDEMGKRYIDFAVDGAKRMRQLILDLLEYSKITRMDNTFENVNLKEVIEEITVLYSRELEEKNAVIETNSLPVLQSFKSPLRQVFQNLISNGLKYRNPDRKLHIKITATEEEKHWLFSVTDNGIGIEEEYYKKIFVIFQRLHGQQFPGTGIGLAITQKIIESMGGKIWVDSTPGEGSTFYFTILK